MTCQPDAVIGDTVLWEIIRTNLFTAVPRLNLRAPRLAQLFLPLRFLQVPEARLEDGQRFELIFQLRLLILAGDNQSCGKMGNAHRRVGRVHTLTAMTGGAIDIDANIVFLDFDLDVFIGLRQDNYLGCGGVNTPIGFGYGYALDTVCASFVL